MPFRASRQTAPFGLDRHDPKSECTSTKLPPTSSFSFAQVATDGQDGSDGRRCFDPMAALAAVVEPKPVRSQSARIGSIPIERNRFLLFIDDQLIRCKLIQLLLTEVALHR